MLLYIGCLGTVANATGNLLWLMDPTNNKVAIVTDSIACIPREMVERYQIGIVPITILAGDKIYRDWVDITSDEAYELFLKDPDDFKTSPASAGDYLDAYRKASKNANNVLCVTLSSKLSTGYNMACVAKEQAETELPLMTVEVLDSENVTASEGFIAIKAARAATEGKDLRGVIEAAKEVRGKVTFFIVLETIKHVYRTGRIPKVAAQVGSMLGVKPILTMSSGLVQFAGAVRNYPRGLDRVVQMMHDQVAQNPVHVAVMHAYASEEAERLKERIASEFNCTELWLTEFSPVMGYACGTGTVGFAFYKEG
jgi:DegV family protein with EDD domain